MSCIDYLSTSVLCKFVGEKNSSDFAALQQKVQFLSNDLEKVRSEKADEMALRVQVENKLRVSVERIQGRSPRLPCLE